MTIVVQPSAKLYAAQLARVKSVRDKLQAMPGIISPSTALGGMAIALINALIARAEAAKPGTIQYISSYNEMRAIGDLP